MKKSILVALSLLFIAASFNSKAQNTKVGIIGGANVSTLYFNPDDYIEDGRLGYQGGIVVDQLLGPLFALHTGAQFITKGAGNQNENNLKLSYVQVPLNLRLKIGIERTNFFLLAGPYLGVAVDAKREFDAGFISGEQDVRIGTGDNDEFKPFDFGLNLGLGAELGGRMLVSLKYDLGITNLNPDDGGIFQGAEYRNATFSLNLGIYLN